MPYPIYIFHIIVMWSVGVTSVCVMAFVALHAGRGGNSQTRGPALVTPRLRTLGLRFDSMTRSWSLENSRSKPLARRNYAKH